MIVQPPQPDALLGPEHVHPEYMPYREDDEHRGFRMVKEQERETIEEKLRQREQRAPCGQRFSIAFSGGGIRAAAFQSGVLWQLARMNKLKDVEYLAAVSGGGYIASAFASHVRAEEERAQEENRMPNGTEEVRRFYLRAVANTMTRMQHNAGDFVRDCFADHGYGPHPGPSKLPRWCDLPILLGTLFFTLLVNPIFFVVAMLVPFTISVELFYGAAMRATFCNLEEFQSMYYSYSQFSRLLNLTAWCILSTFGIYTCKALLPQCQKRRLEPEELGEDEVQQAQLPGYRHQYEAPIGYKLGHAASAFMVRFTVMLGMLVVFVVCVPFAQYIKMPEQVAKQKCAEYVQLKQSLTGVDTCSDRTSDNLGKGEFWYQTVNVTNADAVAAEKEELFLDLPSWWPSQDLFKLSLLVLLVVLGLALVCMPILGATIMKNLIVFFGPFMVFLAALIFVQYAVFGPVTKDNSLLYLGLYDQEKWERFVSCSLLIAMCTIPFYEELRSALHVYYKRCLVQNYFANGSDVSFASLNESMYTPFVILTGTSTDYCPPEDERDTISEISFSSRHTGSHETGYTNMPKFRTLGKCTALTGAGCLDAISLSMSDAVSMRFWLEVLNLSWGDYIIFESESNSCRRFTHWVRDVSTRIGEMFGMEWEGVVHRFLHRIPSGPFWVGFYLAMNIAWHYGYKGSASCGTASTLMHLAIWVLVALVGASFFTFLPVLDLLSLSPMLRQIHQATKYFYVGQPPRMLYVTDGGVKDCTALNQLLWRRCERILLVLAAADPHDELKVLRAALEEAEHLQLGSFFDPADPRKSMKILFDEFKANRDLTFLQVGIRYGWSVAEGREPEIGHLVIIKNRLPTALENEDVEPLLTFREVMGDEGRGQWQDGEDDIWDEIYKESLGPYGCCDCCHTNGFCGNCGPKFPHGTFTGYMWLTPQWCNSLMRLGHDISEAGIEQVTQP